MSTLPPPPLAVPGERGVEAVVCPACHRSNLTGGLRCAYCGTYLSSTLDFDLTAPSQPEPVPPQVEGVTESAPKTGRVVGGVGFLGSLALLALKAKTLVSLLSMGKVLVTLGSMLLFIVADAQLFGWRLGVGFAISILIHELGHVFVNWRKGIPQTAPMFLPFVGAVIMVKRFPDNPQVESESGAGGPTAGGLAAIGCLVLASLTKDPFYLSLAQLGFLINLFNLVPFAFLDGARVGSAFSPKTWWAILFVLVLWGLKVNTPALWLIILGVLLLRLVQKDDGRYLLAPPIVRARMAVLYVLLAIGLSYGASHSFGQRASIAQSQKVKSSVVNEGTVSDRITEEERTDLPQETSKVPSKRLFRFGLLLPLLFQGALFGLVPLLWWAVLRQVGRASGMAWNGAQSRMLLSILGLHVVTQTLAFFAPDAWFPMNAMKPFVLANLAAAAAAFLFGLVQAARSSPVAARPQAALLRLQMLACAAVIVFLVGYAASSLVLLGLLVGLIFAFAVFSPAARYLMLSAVSSVIGDENRAGQYLEQAGQVAPADLAAAISARRVAALLLNERGDKALPLLDTQANQPRGGGDLLQFQSFYVTAFTQTSRFGDALHMLEQTLQSAQNDARLSLVALCLAHYDLALLAFHRGWWDETLAQTDWLLTHTAKTGQLAAVALRLRALAEAERFAEHTVPASTVDAACNRALAQNHDSAARAAIASARISRLLTEGETEAARDEAVKALRLRPFNRQVQYWAARSQGREALTQFTQVAPENFWTQKAIADLAANATFSSAPS